MHRSGTSMLSHVLSQMGVFVGKKLELHHEAIFFQAINRWLLLLSGSSWEHPCPVNSFLSHHDSRRLVARRMRFFMKMPRVLAFLGIRHFLKYRTPENLDFPWCWKDPRNTFTLPVWLDIFPEAKVLYIHRNGVDVANSLAVRGRKELQQMNRLYSWKDMIFNRLPPESSFAVRCLYLEDGFKLWETYCHQADEQIASVPLDRQMVICFEDFLVEPLPFLRRLCDFAGLSPAERRLTEISEGIDAGRARPYETDAKLLEFYEAMRSTELMVRYGYS